MGKRNHSHEQQNYFLHIVAKESPQRLIWYDLSRSLGPHLVGAATPTVHWLIWAKLSALLSEVGIPYAEIELAKAVLDAEGSAEISDVALTDAEIARLGFDTLAA